MANGRRYDADGGLRFAWSLVLPPVMAAVGSVEGDCEQLATVAAFLDRSSVDAVVRHRALDAIAHRSEELDC